MNNKIIVIICHAVCLHYRMDELFVESKHNEIELSENDLVQLKNQESRLVSNFKANQIEKDSRKYWDKFYKRNENRFFKDRHWTTREFAELVSSCDSRRSLLEVGCGTGNFIYPLLIEDQSSFYVYACDFSPRAVDLVKSHPLYEEKLVNAFVADVTTDDLRKVVAENSIDIVTLIFVLSAIHPQHYDVVVRNLHCVLKQNGIILFRDYGLYDMAQIRFKQGHKISENFYMRQDGTRCVLCIRVRSRCEFFPSL